MSSRLLHDADVLSAVLDADHRLLCQDTQTSAEHLDAVAAIDDHLARWSMAGLDDEDATLAAELTERLRSHRRAHVERLRTTRRAERST